MSMQEIFITGTDTGVGKTVVSALLLAGLKEAGFDPIYFKPVQTGVANFLADTQEIRNLSGICTALKSVYEYSQPISPHRAAGLQGETISLERICSSFIHQKLTLKPRGPANREQRFVVEGAGGILCPLTEMEGIRELILKMGSPVLVVASTRLGTINHTLLTLEAAQKKNLNLRGIVLVGEKDEGLAENLEVCSGGVKVIAQVPFEKNPAGDWVRSFGPRLFSEKVLKWIFLGEPGEENEN